MVGGLGTADDGGDGVDGCGGPIAGRGGRKLALQPDAGVQVEADDTPRALKDGVL